ncbi:MAG: glycosyl transferase [Sulfurovum sp.]|nr:glycosyl transferase [Sulfurovum sp.]
MDKIDFVLPWVDANDRHWQKNKERYAPELSDEYDTDTGIIRYRDTNTLKYVLRSIELYCPWYNKIHLITEGHTPEWLDVDHPKINMITHEELYFNKEHLPTFSSPSIEMNLANLKSVSENFVYLNDDFIILRPLSQERFFKNNKPVDFLIHGWVPRNKIFQVLRDDSTWVKSLNNSMKLINTVAKPDRITDKKKIFFHHSYTIIGKLSNFLLLSIWRKYFFIKHWHHPQPYKFSTIKKVHQLFNEPMMQCSQNRFRSDNDLNQYLYRYYHLLKEDFYPYYYNDGYIARIRSLKTLDKILEELESTEYNFVAIFDDYKQEESVQIIDKLTNFLEIKFHKKASFES